MYSKLSHSQTGPPIVYKNQNNMTNKKQITLKYDDQVVRVALARAKKKTLDDVVNAWIEKTLKI